MQSNWLRYAGFEEVGKAAASGLAFSRSWLSESGLRCDLSAKAEVESELELEQHILIAQPGLNGKTEMVPHWDMRARSHRDTTVLDLHLLPAAVPHASESQLIGLMGWPGNELTLQRSEDPGCAMYSSLDYRIDDLKVRRTLNVAYTTPSKASRLRELNL